jgi:branched-chain amino acid transport system substrate-binding protein
MKKLLMASAASALMATGANAEDIKLGVLLAFTGPLESLAPSIAAGAELAIAEATADGAFMDGSSVTPVRGDSTCIDAAAAIATAERLITSDGVKGIVGPMCSGATGAVLQNVAMPNGMLIISPSATSPALSTVEDNGLFFRTAPSDARQGEVMAAMMKERGYNDVAVTYTNNDYGKGLADAFAASWEALGGTITINTAHEDGKADYAAEVGALAAAGGDILVVAGYVDQGGSGIVQAALDTGAFDTFQFPDGMISVTLEEKFGTDIDGSFGQTAGSPAAEKFAEIVGDAFDSTSTYADTGYDAAALILLAMQAAGSTDPMVYKDKVMDVANAPGEQIFPGEIAKGLEILAAGGEIDYVGASAVELVGQGESAGSYRVIEMQDGKLTNIGYR